MHIDYEDIVRQLDAISGGDPEIAHSQADDILLWCFPDEVRDALERLKDRCGWWACA